MSDPNEPIEYVRAAVDDQLAIGFTATCEVRDGKIIVTLCRGKNTDSFALPEDLQEVDSDGIADAIRMPMEKARRALLALESASKPKRKAKKRKKAKRAKRNQLPQRAAPDDKGRDGTEGTNGSPTSTEPTQE
jgi:hypothetical protein